MRAIGAAQNVAHRLDQAAHRPQRDERAKPEEDARARGHHLADRTRQGFRDRRRHRREHRRDRAFAADAAAEQAERRREQDEEGKKRDQREIGEIARVDEAVGVGRSEEHTSELQSLMRISYAVFCLKKKNKKMKTNIKNTTPN